MANDLNRHECIGRLGQDPEIRYLPSGEAVCNISIACGSSWKDKQTGQKQERTTWISYVAFGKLAEIMGAYLKKGSKVYLSGELRVKKWTDQIGADRWTTEIVASEMQMLDSRGDGQQAAPAPQGQPTQPSSRPQQGGQPQRTDLNENGSQRSPYAEQQPPAPPPGYDDFDDDIPFDLAYRGMELMV